MAELNIKVVKYGNEHHIKVDGIKSLIDSLHIGKRVINTVKAIREIEYEIATRAMKG